MKCVSISPSPIGSIQRSLLDFLRSVIRNRSIVAFQSHALNKPAPFQIDVSPIIVGAPTPPVLSVMERRLPTASVGIRRDIPLPVDHLRPPPQVVVDGLGLVDRRRHHANQHYAHKERTEESCLVRICIMAFI